MSLDLPARPESAHSPARADIGARTLRQDRWWLQPLVIFIGFSAFIAYSTWAAFNHPVVAGTNHRIFYADPYLSPFYSPCFIKGCPPQVAWAQLDSWDWLSPAIYILIFPLAFRATCYYYRKAYYRSFWLSPPACAVAEPHKTYTGETRFPLIFQNIHRYAWYFAVIFAGILTWDAVLAFDWGGSFGLGVGTLVLVVNAVLIWGYTLGCHSCRHITAGRINNFSKHPLRYKFWMFVSKLNRKHMQWAWASLIWIALADGYIRLVANGTIHDFHHIF
ncbi:MAG TPA: hypothetical protein VFT62_05145 [Mycobacteriales bacterium]|nr:hypothetical protein [Mycobacteriales bacterium]